MIDSSMIPITMGPLVTSSYCDVGPVVYTRDLSFETTVTFFIHLYQSLVFIFQVYSYVNVVRFTPTLDTSFHVFI